MDRWGFTRSNYLIGGPESGIAQVCTCAFAALMLQGSRVLTCALAAPDLWTREFSPAWPHPDSCDHADSHLRFRTPTVATTQVPTCSSALRQLRVRGFNPVVTHPDRCGSADRPPWVLHLLPRDSAPQQLRVHGFTPATPRQ